MGVYGETTVATLYALFGADHVRTTPALKAEVEHRVKALSRRGFLGIVGAGTAGMMFAPDTGLWTPVPTSEAVTLATTDLGLLARRFALAADAAFSQWAAKWRPSAPESFGGTPARRYILSGSATTDPGYYTDDRLFSIARGGRPGEMPPFNAQHPLPITALHGDPTISVAEALSPEQGILVRIVEWDAPVDMFIRQGPTTRVYDFELAGYYAPRIVTPDVSRAMRRRDRRRPGTFRF